jgi:hypothetical protein
LLRTSRWKPLSEKGQNVDKPSPYEQRLLRQARASKKLPSAKELAKVQPYDRRVALSLALRKIVNS